MKREKEDDIFPERERSEIQRKFGEIDGREFGGDGDEDEGGHD